MKSRIIGLLFVLTGIFLIFNIHELIFLNLFDFLDLLISILLNLLSVAIQTLGTYSYLFKKFFPVSLIFFGLAILLKGIMRSVCVFLGVLSVFVYLLGFLV
jgi:hypothetical protein